MINIYLSMNTGLSTVKYIYGPATVNTELNSVIGSSLHGRIESGIGISRLTTIAMPMRGM
jgi:hypothetical protein